MPFPIHVVLDFRRSIGPIFIATFINLALWGILYLQTIVYFSLYKFDKWTLKSFVVVLLIVTTLEQSLCIAVLWRFLIPTQFGDTVAFTVFPWESILQSPLSGLAVGLAQSFFTWRIWHFSEKNRILLIILVPLISGQFIGCLASTVLQVNKPVSFAETTKTTNFMIGFSVVDAVIDILLASAMCTMLWRGRTGIYLTDRMLVRLMHASMATSLCTVIFALISAIGIIVAPHDLYYLLGEIPFSTLHCNSVLANLNCRKYIKTTKTTSIIDPFTGRSFHINMTDILMEGDGERASMDAAGGVSVDDGTSYNITPMALAPNKSDETRSAS